MTIPEQASTPLLKLEAICEEIFERWDKDQRSGKLLGALGGRLPGYRADVDDVRAALAAAAQSLVGVKCTEDVARAPLPEFIDRQRKKLAEIHGNTQYTKGYGDALSAVERILALPHTGQPQEGLRERALKIIANEERFAATDDKSNIELFALRVARVGTAKQILGELPLDEPILAGAIATTFSAAPASPQRAEGE
jgi:hypothetical protein